MLNHEIHEAHVYSMRQIKKTRDIRKVKTMRQIKKTRDIRKVKTRTIINSLKYNASQTVSNPSEGKIPSACYKTQRNPPLTPGLRTHIQLIYINVHTYPQGSEVIPACNFKIWSPKWSLPFR